VSSGGGDVGVTPCGTCRVGRVVHAPQRGLGPRGRGPLPFPGAGGARLSGAVGAAAVAGGVVRRRVRGRVVGLGEFGGVGGGDRDGEGVGVGPVGASRDGLR